jgi:ribosomal protein S18 acetylase RimI-like enzyme
MSNLLQCVELTGDDQIDAAFELMAVLRPHLRREHFTRQVREQRHESGYRLAGGFDAATRRLLVLAGYKRATTLARGPHLFVDDLVTHPAHRNHGHGKAMLAHLATIAKAMNLEKIWLDSRAAAKTFYEQAGFTMHTSIPCFIDVKNLT